MANSPGPSQNMDRKRDTRMKKFTLKRVVDGLSIGFRTSSTPKEEVAEIEETLKSEHFQVVKTVRHGFPYQPTAMAYDPVQHLLAIGTKNGSLRIFGRPGVDCHVRHEGDVAITQVLFLINEGALVTVCSDDQLHLWTLRQKKPEIVHSIRFQRERITSCNLPFQSKWLYIGTERGNVHIVNIESFVLSGYVINWNKAIELSRKTHPGAVVNLCDNPMDPNKLMIGFESGTIVLWDLKSKTAEMRYTYPEGLTSVTWHHDGKQFMASHKDGSLTTWNIKVPQKPVSVLMPHANMGKDGKPDPCRPISKVEWRTVRNGEPYVIFSGGMPVDKASRTPSLTVMHAKNTTVLEMEHNVVDFITLCYSPWSMDFQDPYAIVVLLQNDLVVVDLTSPGYPCFENPYPMDIHESPVTCCTYFADCPPDLIPALYSVGSKQKRSGFSDKDWPITGGEWGTTACSYPEMVITGHADGSLKFWDASAVSLQVLYKLKTAKVFERHKCRNPDPEDDPFAIQHIHLCMESRLLVAGGLTHCILFHFTKQETGVEVSLLEISLVYEIYDEEDSPEVEYPPIPPSRPQQSHSVGSYSSTASDGKEVLTSVKVKGGQRKWGAGFQPELCMILTWIDGEPPPPITCISINSRYGLIAFGNECGLAIVDYQQKTCLLNMGTPDLYGSMDPYLRVPRSPKSKGQSRPTGMEGLSTPFNMEECKSPTSDQASRDNLLSVNFKGKSHSKGRRWTLPSVLEPTVADLHGGPPMSPHSKTSLQCIDENQMLGPSQGEKQKSGSCGESASSTEMACEALEVDYSSDHSSHEHVFHSADDYNGNSGKMPDNNSPDFTDDQSPFPPKKNLCHSKSLPLGGTQKPGADQAPRIMNRIPSDPTGADLRQEAEDPKKSKSGFMKSFGRKKKDSQSSESLDQAGSRKKKDSQSNESLDQAGNRNSGGFDKDEKASEKAGQGDSEEKAKQNFHNGEVSKPEDNPFDDTDMPTTPKKSLMRRFSEKLRSSMLPGKQNEDEENCQSDLPGGGARKARLDDVKFSMIDLTAEDTNSSTKKMTYTELRNLMDKADGSFSRSRSSSMSSLENISKEAISCLAFTDAFARKTDSATCPSLWVGTSLGSVLVTILQLPTDPEARKVQPVIVSPSGTIFRLKGAILAITFLDCNGVLIPAQTDQWTDPAKDKRNPNLRQQSVSSMKARMSPTSSTDQSSDKQFAIICSEKQARVMSLPSQTCTYKVKITETSVVIKAEVVTIKDSVCLICYVANGHIMTFTLPSLKPLVDVDFLPNVNERIAKTLSFSNNGHVLFFCSPTEMQKVSISADHSDNLNEMLGELFLPCETPEAPRPSLFQKLVGGGPGTLDREELFGESSGKASRGVAVKTSPMSMVQEKAGSATSEIGRAKMLALERGQKLGDVEERTEQMKLDAEEYSRTAHQLMLKYKDKKWYQF